MTCRQPASFSRRRRWATLAFALVCASATGLVGAQAAPTSGDTAGTALGGTATLVFVDGDHVVFSVTDDEDTVSHTDAKGAGAGAGGTVRHEGYATYGDATLLEHYEVRLVESDGIETIRPYVTEAVAQATAAGGQSLAVRPGTVDRSAPERGQIDIVVSSSSPCSGLWLGCGGPTVEEGKVQAGQIWINPRVFDRPTDQIANTVRHELGHTLGLAHYEYLHEDRVQTMHPSRFDAATYESGDAAGLRAVSGTPPATAQASAPPAQVQATDPVGSIDPAAGPLGLVVRGWALDPDTTEPITVTVTVDGAPVDVLADLDGPADAGTPRSGHGYETVRLARSGTYEVCVVARNVGAGHDTPLGCEQVTVTASGVARIGLQTV